MAIPSKGPLADQAPRRPHGFVQTNCRPFVDFPTTGAPYSIDNQIQPSEQGLQETESEHGSQHPEDQTLAGSLNGGSQHDAPLLVDVLGQDYAQRLAAIVESSEDAIISKDLNGIIASWNHGAERLFGYRAEEVIGRSITLLFPRDLVHEEDDILARIRRGEPIEHYETVRRRKDGRPVPISLTVSPIVGGDSQVIGASKVARDISGRKRAERMQSALFELTDRLFRARSANDIYNAALDAIIQALDCQRASILLFDHSGIMKFVAWRGLSDGYRSAAEGHSPWTAASKNPEPICVNEIGAADFDQALKATIRAEGIEVIAFIPVCANDQVIGKFMAYYSSPHAFDDADLSIAVTIARQLGFGIERLRAEEHRRQAEATKQLLLDERRHRIKNIIATVQAIAGQTLRHSNPEDLEAFLARLRALSEAHELLSTKSWHRLPYATLSSAPCGRFRLSMETGLSRAARLSSCPPPTPCILRCACTSSPPMPQNTEHSPTAPGKSKCHGAWRKKTAPG